MARADLLVTLADTAMVKISDAHKAKIVAAVTEAFRIDLARVIADVDIEAGEILQITKRFDVLIPEEGKEPVKFFNSSAARFHS